jgi:glycosyltransferase involved in cell wall biosynthesis
MRTVSAGSLTSTISPRVESLAILTQQVSNYHAARFEAAALRFKTLSVLSSMNDAEFPELLHQTDRSTIHLFNSKIDYFVALSNGQLWTATQAALDAIRPDVVAVAGWAFSESLAAIAWARANGAHLVMMSDSQMEDGRRHWLREAIKSRIVRCCDSALVGGQKQREYIIQLGMEHSGVFLGYDAVDNTFFAEGADRARAEATRLRQSFGLPNRYVLASARFIAKKNLAGLVTAFAHALRITQTRHDLVILGDGDGRKEIEDCISKLGMSDRIHLPGFKPYDTLPVYYGLADGFAHVSLTEQWGLVINEAAAAGLPLIVSRPCGAADQLVVDGMNGHLVDPENIANMAWGLGALMGASDTELQAMGAASRKIVKDWGPARFAAGLELAAEAARAQPSRRLARLDKTLLHTLSRHRIERVR